MPTNQDRIDAILNLINDRNFQEAYDGSDDGYSDI